MKRHMAACVIVLAALTGFLTSCDNPEDSNSVPRGGDPVVLTGAKLPTLVGTAPARIVAFAHSRVGGTPKWAQVPVQVDQRKVVGFGSNPGSNGTAGVTGTVYGNGATGVTALQYADPNTWVGADGDATFDADDELVFITGDAGGKPRTGERTEPSGVVAGSGVQVQVDDPASSTRHGWVYLFKTTGGLDPAAGKDYVDYDFVLDGGTYKANYKRATGPNPESSTVVTDSYRIEFGDRWIEDSWRDDAGDATGADILDGHKNQFAIGDCGRSNATFAAAEGAFVANIDGPVRAIRSYVGANSGPRTQRTHLLYRDREEVITDLRVHPIPQIMDFLDMSAAAKGMTYRSSTLPNGVALDGVLDSVPTTPAQWEAYTGAQGAVFTAVRYSSSIPNIGNQVTWFQQDQTTPPQTQCWGDGSLLGAAGPLLDLNDANTEPATPPFETLKGRRVTLFVAPLTDTGLIDDIGGGIAAQIDAPLTTSVSGYTI